MRMTWLPAVMILSCGVFVPTYRAQHATPRAEPTALLFPSIFPCPTGQNGYEEFVKAVDLLNNSPACQQYERDYDEPDGAPLAAERRVLADMMALRVLETMKKGLKKSIQSPRENPELTTLVPELRVFRSVGRLLCAEIDVLFADGQTTKATNCLNDALNFGHAAQVGFPLSGVVGLYVQNITLRTFSRHLNQLTTQDCEKLVRIVKHHVAPPDPQIALIESERDAFIRSLWKYRGNAGEFLDQAAPGPNAGASAKADYTSVYRTVKANPASGKAIFDRAAELVALHYGRTLSQFSRPVWERHYPLPDERETPAAKLVFSICPPSYSRMGDRFASEQAMAQIIGTHAAVFRYQLQHNQLPHSLTELNLGSLAIDPFTGQSLGYERLEGQAYIVFSEGPLNPADSKRTPTGLRAAISVSNTSHR